MRNSLWPRPPRLIHELRLHQIELEMQNDEFRLSQARLEESRSKYVNFYAVAPEGYPPRVLLIAFASLSSRFS